MNDPSPVAAPPPLLRVHALSVRFGGIQALNGLDLELAPGARCGIVGPNGSGKTTLFNCITRLQPYAHGQIEYQGRCLRPLAAHQLCRMGISRTFQHQALFDSLSVREHLWWAAETVTPLRPWVRWLDLPAARRARAQIDARVEPLLADLGLAQVAEQPVRHLTSALRKQLDLARALASQPRLLLLDEPASGLDDAAIDRLAALLNRINTEYGTTLLLIEHRMRLVQALCTQVWRMQLGRLVPHDASEPEHKRAA